MSHDEGPLMLVAAGGIALVLGILYVAHIMSDAISHIEKLITAIIGG